MRFYVSPFNLILKYNWLSDVIFIFKHTVYLYLIILFGCDVIFCILWSFGFYHLDTSRASKAGFLYRLKEVGSISITSLPPIFFTLLNTLCVLSLHRTWWWYLPYTLYGFLDYTPFVGGRPSSFFRHLPIWRHSADYFPTTLHMTTSFNSNADKPYIFCYHPHGIFSAGAILAFASEALHVSSIVPGIKIFPCTLTSLFRVPFFRDWLLLQGFIGVSSKSIQYILSKGRGYGVMVVVGGASEAEHTCHDTYNLILLKRKGIFKQALLHGCNIVPVFCFGENNIYRIHKPSLIIRWISDLCKRSLGFCIPPFTGRGVLQTNFGCLPFRHPLHIVVGPPLAVPIIKNPTTEDINKVQKEYRDALCELFDNFKRTGCSKETSCHLRFVS